MSWSHEHPAISPECCEQMKESRAIRLYHNFHQEYDSNVPPVWNVTGHTLTSRLFGAGKRAYLESDESFEAKFCPFCGTKVPEIQKKAILPEKIQVITDGGYYCDTCAKRLDSCSCAGAEECWEIKK